MRGIGESIRRRCTVAAIVTALGLLAPDASAQWAFGAAYGIGNHAESSSETNGFLSASGEWRPTPSLSIGLGTDSIPSVFRTWMEFFARMAWRPAQSPRSLTPVGSSRWRGPWGVPTGSAHLQGPLAMSTGSVHWQGPFAGSICRVHLQGP